MELSTRARRSLATVLAVFLAVESVSAVAVAATTGATMGATGAEPTAGTPAGTVLALEATRAPAWASETAHEWAADLATATTWRAPARAKQPGESVEAPDLAAAAAVAPARDAVPDRAATAATTRPTTKAPAKVAPKAAAKATPSTTRPRAPRPASYAGRNHVWIPSLGISRSVRSFPCSRTRPPDSFMYRWGCAGSNNVYLLGHAYSVMKPLHDAYVRGRLRVGMKAYYADGAGKVHTYVVRWWKKTRPTTDASWAWAPQAVPSMTLQTCVGAHSEYRLMVRLVETRR